jgi:hypothetical protein
MMRFARLAPYLFLIALGLLFFWKLAFTDMILARGDTYAYFYPYWDVRNAAFRAGELPLWTPDIFMGAPLLANPQLGTFYPPNWLTIPFNAPDAIGYSILLHIVWAAAGVFVLFRQTITKNIAPALLAASVFALSGYLGAHVEQINQLQGLAWMPWLFYFFHQALTSQRRILWGIVLAVGFALQIFSGHTQTVFISGVGLGIYAIVFGIMDMLDNRAQHALPLQIVRKIGLPIVILGLAAVGAVLLATPQILPTLELTGMSNRGGGFTAQEATAFSLPPQYIGRALLPSYDGQLFTEYVGYVGVIALGLAILAVITPTRNDLPDNTRKNIRIIWIVLALIGLLFAIGRYNPLYWQLAALPGFNLFRVPARWLSLFVLAVAMLAGMGLDLLQSQKIDYKRIITAIVPLVLLMLMGRFVLVEQVDIVGSAVPTRITMIMWGLALAAFIAVAFLGIKTSFPQFPFQSITQDETPPLYRSARNAPSGVERGLGGEVIVLILVILELFLASRVLPYNDLTPRDVYEGQRFTISQLLAYRDEQTPPGRVLSISQLYFDPGDKARLLERYQQMGMDEQAIQTAFTAFKRQEMLFPNLSMTWGIPSIDGYEGGVLPTIYYSQFTSLLLPEGTPRTIDGRLGELMALPECRGACIPRLDMLVTTDIRYIIADKVYDVVYEGIRFDTTLAGTTSGVYHPPNGFEADTIYILHSGDIETDVVIVSPAIEEALTLPSVRLEFLAEIDDMQLSRLVLDEPIPITLVSTDKILWNIDAITIVDSRTGDFQQLTPFEFDLMLSSDIRIYHFSPSFMALWDRHAYIHHEGIFVPDTWQGSEDALKGNLRNIIHTNEPFILERNNEIVGSPTPSAEILSYQPNRVELRTIGLDNESFLFLNDAYYPGWRATVNGEDTPIYRANVMFRAVRVPAGESTVIFEFVPSLWYWSMAFGAVMWVVAIGVCIAIWNKGYRTARMLSLQNVQTL